MARGRELRSPDEMVQVRLTQEWRRRILAAASAEFPRASYHVGLYRDVQAWRLVVTPRTYAAADAVGGLRGEDVIYRVEYRDNAYRFVR